MKTKGKLLFSSVIAIIFCLSLMIGATFALFTSESKVNVAVSSGKVSVVANAENLELYSGVWNDTTKVYGKYRSYRYGRVHRCFIEQNCQSVQKILWYYTKSVFDKYKTELCRNVFEKNGYSYYKANCRNGGF